MAEEVDEACASATSPTSAAPEPGEAVLSAINNNNNQVANLGESSTSQLGTSGPINLALSQLQTRSVPGTAFSSGIMLDDDKLVNTFDNRIRKFPNLNYSTLYHSLLNLIEVVPNIQTNQISIGQALIHTFGCLSPFLTDDLIDSLPYTIALTLTSFPRDLHKYIMEVLCNSLLPIASIKFVKNI